MSWEGIQSCTNFLGGYPVIQQCLGRISYHTTMSWDDIQSYNNVFGGYSVIQNVLRRYQVLNNVLGGYPVIQQCPERISRHTTMSWEDIQSYKKVFERYPVILFFWEDIQCLRRTSRHKSISWKDNQLYNQGLGRMSSHTTISGEYLVIQQCLRRISSKTAPKMGKSYWDDSQQTSISHKEGLALSFMFYSTHNNLLTLT